MIKKVFKPGDYPRNIDFVLLLLRLTVAAFMLTHGWDKFLRLFGDAPIQFADPIGIGATASLVLTVFSEVFCSVFLIFGFVTRLSAVPLLITMLVAAFIVHASDGFGRQELPLFYAISYVILIIAGAGKLSVDKWIYDRMSN